VEAHSKESEEATEHPMLMMMQRGESEFPEAPHRFIE
jgi:hypothetical protein